MVVQQPSKLNTRVRFPLPAPAETRSLEPSHTKSEILSASSSWCSQLAESCGGSIIASTEKRRSSRSALILPLGWRMHDANAMTLASYSPSEKTHRERSNGRRSRPNCRQKQPSRQLPLSSARSASVMARRLGHPEPQPAASIFCRCSRDRSVSSQSLRSSPPMCWPLFEELKARASWKVPGAPCNLRARYSATPSLPPGFDPTRPEICVSWPMADRFVSARRISVDSRGNFEGEELHRYPEPLPLLAKCASDSLAQQVLAEQHAYGDAGNGSRQ